MGENHATVEQLIEQVSAAAQSRTPVQIVGANSKAFLGRQVSGNAQVLSLAELTGVTSYEPTELVITAAAGTPMVELEAELALQRQMFGFEPPHFGVGATVGGTIAAGLSGPRRPFAGSARDYVLGVKIINGEGKHLRFGGQVMKNVAGYDVSRLMCGAYGTLGVITEVSLRVLPLPAREITLVTPMKQPAALEKLSAWGQKPFPLSAAAWFENQLTVRLSGAASAVASAAAELGGDELAAADGEHFWQQLREQQCPFFAGLAPLWRISIPPATAPLALPKDAAELIDWGGALRWIRTNAPGSELFALAAAANGHAQLFRGADQSDEIFQPLAAPLMELHRQLKNSFDPQGIFNPGRLYGAF